MADFFNKKINLKDGQIYQMPASPNPHSLALIGFTSSIKPGVKPNPTLKLATQSNTATVNQHPPVQHQGWMICDQETVFCWVPVPWLTRVVSSVALFTTYQLGR